MTTSIHPARSSRTRRTLALATAGLLTASGLALTSTGADAALSNDVGPAGVGGFPSYYRDLNGLALQQCLEGPPRCLTTEAELLNAPDGEGFYFSAASSAGGIDIALDLEMAWLEVGQPIVFQRTQYSANGGGLVANGVYRIRDPYGTGECQADALGKIKTNACRTQTGGGASVFTDAVSGRIGPFLAFDPITDAPAGYLGDGVTEHAVTGSPSGFNRVWVSGPGIVGTCTDGTTTWADCNENTLFTVSGKLANQALGHLDRSALNFGAVTSPVTQHVTYRSIGTGAISVTGVSATPPFSVANNTCGADIASGQTCGFDVTYTPVPGVTSTGSVSVVDGTGTKRINLSGKGAQAAIALSTARAVLPDTEVGKDSSALVTVANNGDLPFTLGTATLDGPQAGEYRFGLTPNECLPGASLAVGARCDLRLVFAPRGTGVRAATLNVPAEAGGVRSVGVVGEGLADRTAPVLTQRKPAPGAKRVRPGADVVAVFSEPVTGVKGRTMRLVDLRTGNPVRARVTQVSGDRWKLDPRKKLRRNTDYRVRLVGVRSGIRDLSGNRLGNVGWKFHTR